MAAASTLSLCLVKRSNSDRHLVAGFSPGWALYHSRYLQFKVTIASGTETSMAGHETGHFLPVEVAQQGVGGGVRELLVHLIGRPADMRGQNNIR